MSEHIENPGRSPRRIFSPWRRLLANSRSWCRRPTNSASGWSRRWKNFPRSYRFSVGDRLVHGVLDLLLRLVDWRVLARQSWNSCRGERDAESHAVPVAHGKRPEPADCGFLRACRGAGGGDRTDGRRLAEKGPDGVQPARIALFTTGLAANLGPVSLRRRRLSSRRASPDRSHSRLSPLRRRRAHSARPLS